VPPALEAWPEDIIVSSAALRALRPDLQVVAELIEPGTRVLDIGCGDGALLDYLGQVKNVDARGIEIRQDGVNNCVAAGLSVIQGDANTDLSLYPTKSFDYVVLTQTLQAVQSPRDVLAELVRVGRYTIVSIPNFAFWRVRLSLLFGGRMPVTETLDHRWYETPNIHLCTIQDFIDLTSTMNLTIEREIVMDAKGRPSRLPAASIRANLLGEQAIFLLYCSE
jgi:methionine biosynthesis protein MetW